MGSKIDAVLVKEKYNDHEMKLEKNIDYAFGILIYFCITIWSYYNYWGSPDLPRSIGGTGEDEVLYQNFPYTVSDMPYADYYYMFQLGYHFHN